MFDKICCIPTESFCTSLLDSLHGGKTWQDNKDTRTLCINAYLSYLSCGPWHILFGKLLKQCCLQSESLHICSRDGTLHLNDMCDKLIDRQLILLRNGCKRFEIVLWHPDVYAQSPESMFKPVIFHCPDQLGDRKESRVLGVRDLQDGCHLFGAVKSVYLIPWFYKCLEQSVFECLG